MTRDQLAKMLHNSGITAQALNDDPNLLAVVYITSGPCLFNMTAAPREFKFFLCVTEENDDLLVGEGWKETLAAVQRLEDGK